MIAHNVIWVGVNDRELDLFESQYPVPNGMAYNSYAIVDEKIAVVDAVEIRFADEWLGNIARALEGKKPDYLIVQHMEPDHSGSILRFAVAYPEAKIVASARAFTMMKNFFGTNFAHRAVTVGEGDTLSLGGRTLSFIPAAMVHWPEVVMTYMAEDKILFSADAFGKFGTLDTEEDWVAEARRYYIGIVGKYGGPVQTVLKKTAGLDIGTICPLHGPVLAGDLAPYLKLYNTWSSYDAEEEGIVIAYTSIYGNTKKAALALAEKLKSDCCLPVVTYDLARCDVFAAVADAFRYSKLVLATTTYNGDAFPAMSEFIDHLVRRGYTRRTVAFVENGSWAPAAKRAMKQLLDECKALNYVEPTVTLRSALNAESEAQLAVLAEELLKEGCPCTVTEEGGGKKRFVCSVCGYVHEADELPADFVCPLCKQGAEVFKEEGGKKKFVCKVCGYVHEADELPADFVCPLCKQGADAFEEMQ